MKTKLTLALLVMTAFMYLISLQPALGAITGTTQVSELDLLLGVDKKAPGTKVDLTLTIYFERKGPHEDCGEPNELTDMHYFIRAKIGNDNLTKAGSSDTVDINKSDILYPFAGVEKNVCYADTGGQGQVIKDFIRTVVVQELFFGETFADEDIQIKSVNMIVQDDSTAFPGCCDDDGNDIFFMVMDVVIAVH